MTQTRRVFLGLLGLVPAAPLGPWLPSCVIETELVDGGIDEQGFAVQVPTGRESGWIGGVRVPCSMAEQYGNFICWRARLLRRWH